MKTLIYISLFLILQHKDSASSQIAHIRKPVVVVISFDNTFIVKDGKDSMIEIHPAPDLQKYIIQYKPNDTIR